MLLGTYQEIPYNDNHEVCLPHEVPRTVNESLGFAPVWCFPILSMEDFFAQSICVAPNFPQVLYIVETDDFIKLDKIKMYRDINDGGRNENLLYYKNNDIPDDRAEFVIKPELLRSSLMTIFLCNLSQFTDGNCSINKIFPFFRNNEGFSFEHESYLREKLMFINNAYGVDKSFIEEYKDKIKGPVEYRIFNEKNKVLFQYVMLPLIYKILKDDESELLWCNACLHSNNRAAILNKQLSEWARNDCSVEKYYEIYNELKHCVINNRELLIQLEEGVKIGRNSPCPCGSGLKYKKCHGKYIE